MRILWIFVVLTLILTASYVSCNDNYDAETCGLPGAKYEEPRTKRKYPWRRKRPHHHARRDPAGRRRVMGGVKVQVDELPWTVLIRTTDGKKVCGGTLIGKRHVLTAAHCFWKYDDVTHCTTDDMYPIEEALRITKVMVGGVCWEPTNEHSCGDSFAGKWMGIESASYTSFFEHGCSTSNDIAFLKLSEAIPDGTHHICLPHLHKADQLFTTSITLLSAGFGTDPLNGQVSEPSPWLQKVVLGEKMPDEECNRLMPSRKPDTLCTYERSRRNVCHGDSGAGVTASLNGTYYLLGLVSLGTPCEELISGSRPDAQVHTDIAFYTAEINKFLGVGVEDSKGKWKSSQQQLGKLTFKKKPKQW